MPDVVSRATEADRSDWDAFVEGHTGASGYHAWAWRDVFSRAFGHESIYLIARRQQAIAGVLPLVRMSSPLFGRILTSLPFVNYGGVVADDDATERLLLNEASAIAGRLNCRHLELRHIARRFADLPCREHKVTMRLQLAPGQWERLDRKVRNQVRKAQKSSLTAESGGAELLPDFYTVFARNMRDLGTPVYARALFDEVLRAFPGRARVMVVRLEGRPIAAGIGYRTGRLFEVPWASSIREYNALCPNHMLYWHAIESALGEGVEVFDFGRSTPGEGTFKFKAQWGAQPVPLHWEYWLPPGHELPDQGPTNPKFKLAIEGWKRLPLWLANAAGPKIVRWIP
jgi:serine/alanine adding enzyme